MHDDYVRLEESLQEMNEKVAQFESAIVFVEGPTDVKILKHAKAVLGFGGLVCEIESANGASDITAYLKKHVIQVELVIVTSLIAVSRKIIILDLEKKDSNDLIAMAVAVFSLSISYFVIRQANSKNN